MTEKLDILIDSFNQVKEQFTSSVAKQDDELQELKHVTTGTAAEMRSLQDQLTSLATEINGAVEQISEMQAKAGRPAYGENRHAGTPGRQFIESDTFKDMISKNGKGTEWVDVKKFYAPSMRQKTEVLTDTSPNHADLPVWGSTLLPNYQEILFAPLTMRDLVRSVPTTSNSFEYVVETGFTNNADIVPEGSYKPESAIAFDLETESVKTIAHWIPVSRQARDDISILMDHIDNRLLLGLRQVEESQFLYGAGGTDIQGLLTNGNRQEYDQADVATDNKMDAIRRAVTKIQLEYMQPTGVVVHPNDWEDMCLSKDDESRYLWGVVVPSNQMGPESLWRLPVVVTTSINEGTALVGAFNQAVIYDREQASIRMADQHSDFFIRNMFVLLAEERLAMINFRPAAFVDVTFAGS